MLWISLFRVPPPDVVPLYRLTLSWVSLWLVDPFLMQAFLFWVSPPGIVPLYRLLLSGALLRLVSPFMLQTSLFWVPPLGVVPLYHLPLSWVSLQLVGPFIGFLWLTPHHLDSWVADGIPTIWVISPIVNHTYTTSPIL